MSNLISQLTLLSPEIFVALMAMLILLLDLFIQDKNKHLIYGLSQLTLLVAGLLTASLGFSEPQFAFKDMFVFDSLALFLKMMSFITLSIVFIYSRNYLLNKKLITRKKSLFDCKVVAQLIPKKRSIDIDDQIDFKIAKYLYEKKISI